MAENTAIEWADDTFNPWIGCQKLSPACANCYAEAMVERFKGDFSVRTRTSAANWKKPLTWNAKAAKAGVRRRVFCASLADVFDNQVPEEWRTDLWALIRATPHLDWLLLTKRPQNIAKMLPADWGDGYPNVWLGTTAENQTEADRRIPHLLAVPAVVRFLSMEPLLGPVILPGNFMALGANAWAICGGESGHGARPMHPDWARSLRDQCVAAGVPFLFKQWGEWVSVSEVAGSGAHFQFEDGSTLRRVGKKAAGRMLDGRTWDQLPTGAP